MTYSRNAAVVESVRTSTVKATASKFGISPSRVSQIVKRHKLSALADELTDDEKERWLEATEAIESDMKLILAAGARVAKNWTVRNELVAVVAMRRQLSSSVKTGRASQQGH